MAKIFKGLIYLAFLLAFVWVVGQLFYTEKTNSVYIGIKEFFIPSEEEQLEPIKDLRIIFPTEISSLEPTIVDTSTRQRVVNIYESLVKLDRDLHTVPSLAKSWGLIDDLTWNMTLREGVVFHDNSDFDAYDVLASFNRAKNYSSSQLKDFFSFIKELKVIDPYHINIITDKPEPLLLQKLSILQIIPSEYEEKRLSTPIGTGSYEFSSWSSGSNMVLKRFNKHWSGGSVFDSVEILVIPDKSERIRALLNGEANFLAFVPQDSVDYMRQSSFELRSIPSLEVQFLIFNMDSELMSRLDLRRIVSYSIDKKNLVSSFGELVRPVNQFVSTGVFGFNTEIADDVYDLEEARELVVSTNTESDSVIFHFPEGAELLGGHLKTQLSKVGLLAKVSYLSNEDLERSFNERDADVYFLAFKSAYGDASEFLTSVVYSGAELNIGAYSNPDLDDLIDKIIVEMDDEKRLEYLNDAMAIIVEKDLIGVPLLEFDTIYAFVQGIDMSPRIDGLIYFDELILN